MAKLHRDDILFATAGLVAVLVVAAAAAAARWYAVQWWLGNCGESATCTAMDAFTDYWWAPFALLVMVLAWGLNRRYQARLLARNPETN